MARQIGCALKLTNLPDFSPTAANSEGLLQAENYAGPESDVYSCNLKTEITGKSKRIVLFR
ncbi:MAG: hypothetical protein JSV52_13235 [Candidatus Zixiibacteriota bacterium]|nr:MAG: hypothetical protein JSV52_13235 [candidate division Zixibacteria bacterium]